MKPKRWIAVCSAALVLLAACGKKEQEAEHEVVAPVQVAEAKKGTIDRVISADAVLYPVNQANVMPKISAPVLRVLVNRGDHVRAGQLVAELESRDLAAAANESKGQWEQAQAAYQAMTGATALDEKTKSEADVASARQAFEAAKKVYESRVELVKQGAFAQKLADDARVAMVQAQGQFETSQRHLQTLNSVGQREQTRGLQAAIDAAKARFDNTQAQVSYAAITSPISGVVSERPVYPGEMAAAGSPLVSIVDVSQVVARTNVSMRDASFVKVGDAASIVGPEGEAAAKVTVVSPAVNPSTTTLEVWVQAANPGEKLKPGTTVRVNIKSETLKDVVIVPVSALLNADDGGQRVIVVGTDNTVQERKVVVGVRNGDTQQIVSGVVPGDRVVVTGGLGLENKAKVKIVQAGGPAPSAAADEDEKK
ncbi:MAG: efflux transporter, family, subunit [Bryobacterales bacterium]|nr:efflux transporter, family, subunit [Bryobacterales bacterium]